MPKRILEREPAALLAQHSVATQARVPASLMGEVLGSFNVIAVAFLGEAGVDELRVLDDRIARLNKAATATARMDF